MPRKQGSRVSRRKRTSLPTQSQAAQIRASAVNPHPEDLPEDELTSQIVRGCLIARDALFNVRDFLAEGSRLAFLAIKDCEKELDQIERKIDEQLARSHHPRR